MRALVRNSTGLALRAPIARFKRRAALSISAAAALLACGGTGPAAARAVTLHSPAACAVGDSPFALYFATGDFEPAGPAGPSAQIFLDAQGIGSTLSGLPAAMRELSVAVT